MANTDDALRRELAQALYEHDNRNCRNVWTWDSSGLDDEHPGTRQQYEQRAAALLAGPVGKRIAALQARNADLKAERDAAWRMNADFAKDRDHWWKRAQIAEARISELEAEREADKSCIEADGIQISYLRATISKLEAENTRLLKAMTEA